MKCFSKIHELDPVKAAGQGLLDKDIVSMRLCRPVERFGPVIKSSSFRWKGTCPVLPAEDGLTSAEGLGLGVAGSHGLEQLNSHLTSLSVSQPRTVPIIWNYAKCPEASCDKPSFRMRCMYAEAVLF